MLALFEGAARVAEIWWPPTPIDFGNGFDSNSRLFIPVEGEPGVLMTNPRKAKVFERQRFEDPKPAGTMRIIAVGESSIARLQEELLVMEKRMQETLVPAGVRAQVLNAGGRSYGSQRLLLVAAEVANYQPDAVMIYMGHNEFEEVEQLVVSFPESSGLQESLSGSALVRFTRERSLEFQKRILQDEHNKRILSRARPDHARAWRHQFTPEEVEVRMAAFKNNLERMILLFKQNGTPVVIGTVPSNLVKPYLPKDEHAKYERVWELLEQGKHAEAEVLGRQVLRQAVGRHQSSPRENEIIRALAEQHQLPLADVEAAITQAEPHHVPGETLFADHCHLNAAGNTILRQVFEEKLRAVLKPAQ